MKLNSIVFVLFASGLSACGGGSSAPGSTIKAATPPVSSAPAGASMPTPPLAVASMPVITIVTYGDDEMLGDAISPYGSSTMVSPTEPAALQALLQTEFNDSGVTVINATSGGTSSSLQNELDGMDGMGEGQPARMVASAAKIAIEQHALNDALGGETVEQYAAYLGQWIQDARANGIQPVLEEDSPVCDDNHPQLAAYATAVDAAGKQYGVPVIAQYNYVLSIPDWQAHMLDCIVPDAYLSGLKAKQEQTVIAPLVKVLIDGQS